MKLLENFGISFHLYGFILGVAVVASLLMAERIIKKHYKAKRLNKSEIDKAAWWIVGFGVFGARAYHVVEFWGYYSKNLSEVLALWNGGLAIYGAVLGGLLGGGVYIKLSLKKFSKKKYFQKMYELVDVVSPGLLLSQAIGRLGNFVNQEIYGYPTKLPWGIFIKKENRLLGFEKFEYFHPLFMYEALWNLIGFLILMYLMKKKKLIFGKGNYFVIYLFWYGLGRAVLEPMRIVYTKIWGLPAASIIGVGMMFLSVLFVYIRRKNSEW